MGDGRGGGDCQVDGAPMGLASSVMGGGSQANPLAGRSGADGQQLEGGLDRADGRTLSQEVQRQLT